MGPALEWDPGPRATSGAGSSPRKAPKASKSVHSHDMFKYTNMRC